MQPVVAAGSIVREGRRVEFDAILDVILAANPHLHDRIFTFRSKGRWWSGVRAIVAESAGQLVSVALTFRREVWSIAGPKKLAGIGAVATHPECRGRGLAGAVLEGSERMFSEEGFPSVVLFCTIVSFYERLGWRCLQPQFIDWPDPEPLPSSYEQRVLDVVSAWPAMAAVYEQAATGAVVRSAELWQESADWRRDDPSLTLGAFEGGNLGAYVRGRKNAQGLEVVEATAIHGHEHALGGLIQEQTRIARSAHIPPQGLRMMTKRLAVAGSNGALEVESENSGAKLPWEPRIWWPIDFF